MRLTLHTDYSIRALLYLAHNPGKRIAIQEIADTHRISQHHLVKVIHRLSTSQIVLARRGRNGGIELAREPRQIIIGDIVRLMEADLAAIVACIPDTGQQCILADACRLRGLFSRSMNAFMGVLDRLTLHDILHDDKKN
ncbi:RrF2 family transcriptional regulator [Komagataeibacter medellinensis]|uniref:Transcriptional regulator Rrf2 family n=1 Tax=Komagataeibacter medellinensis (strain NBRC 3288 / BCRC 11682 / LMG 1693 / Kondo 51) TaxID=634177 RepID=G2I3Z3_KOMMN|nr:Rrf2 family transcriptional regulator [Komagataeibacter medellinensis]BAK82840.1 transcriptional regulator Rrf2 family [Komagataeibacter medellinensis NBRC 3288]